MLILSIVAVTLVGMGERPQALLGRDGADGYLAKLEEKLATPAFVALIDTAIPGCKSLTHQSADYLELQNQDFGTSEFYNSVAVKPVLLERILVSGCGQALQVNLMALRLQAAPNDLKFTFQMVGETGASPLLQRDAYTYVSMAVNNAQTINGDNTPCDKTAMIYNTQMIVEPKGTSPWKEVWSVSKCDYKARVAVEFIPKPEGGTRIGTRVLKDNE